MGGVGTSIIGRPRPLPGDRRAASGYTLNCEEPLMLAARDQMNSTVEENRNLAGSKMRRAAERLAKQINVAARRAAGEAAADISQYEGHNLDTLHPLVTAYAAQANEPGVARSVALLGA